MHHVVSLNIEIIPERPINKQLLQGVFVPNFTCSPPSSLPRLRLGDWLWLVSRLATARPKPDTWGSRATVAKKRRQGAKLAGDEEEQKEKKKGEGEGVDGLDRHTGGERARWEAIWQKRQEEVR